jgi:hypothetical protein
MAGARYPGHAMANEPPAGWRNAWHSRRVLGRCCWPPRTFIGGSGGRLAIPFGDPEAALADPMLVAGNWLAAALKVGPGWSRWRLSTPGAGSFLAVWCWSVLARVSSSARSLATSAAPAARVATRSAAAF